MIIHYCNHSSQPYITIACSGLSYYVWCKSNELPEGIYEADDGFIYTFDVEKVTCDECKKITKKE